MRTFHSDGHGAAIAPRRPALVRSPLTAPEPTVASSLDGRLAEAVGSSPPRSNPGPRSSLACESYAMTGVGNLLRSRSGTRRTEKR